MFGLFDPTQTWEDFKIKSIILHTLQALLVCCKSESSKLKASICASTFVFCLYVTVSKNMITAVYCCVYLLFVAFCQCQNILDDDGYSNDSPFIEPDIQTIRVKAGAQLKLKCHLHHHHKGTSWEYKQCETNYKGVICDVKDLNNVDTKEKSWKRLNNDIKGKVEIEHLNKSHNGMYRCLEKGKVKKSFIVEVVGPGNFEGPPPKVATLKTSNITSQLNMEFTIQCNVTSIIPPTIIWFKKCYGLKCDIEHGDICYCLLNISTSTYNIGNTYLSKINIFNARDIDSGLYACLAVTEYGKDYKNVTIQVPSIDCKDENKSFSLLFLIPLTLIFAPIAVWLCYYKRKKKPAVIVIDQQKKLIKPVVQVAEELSEVL